MARAFALPLAALAALAACGCEDAASPYFGSTRRATTDSATFYVNAGSEPEYLDPGKCADAGCAALVTQLFEGLTRYHPDDAHPVQGVAERWEKSDDNRRFRFHLRPDARWSDGRPVTAGDFEYAWKRALSPATASRVAGTLYALKNAEAFRLGKLKDPALVGVHATDDLTLDVELERPTPYFLDLTSHRAYSPVRRDVIEAFERRGEGDLWTRPESFVGNGPYVLDRWDFQYQITMKDNPFYWDRARLAIRRIVWVEVEDYHATLNLYKTGELDFIGDSLSLPAEYQAILSGKRDYRRDDYLAVYWYDINTKRPPLDDPRVRRALDLSIDKAQLVARVTRGGQRPATHYVPDATGSGYSEQADADRARGKGPFQGYGFDPERARALLAEAGFTPVRDGSGWRAPGFPPIEIVYNTGEGHRLIAIAVQAMWKENLGVTALLRNEEWKVMLKTHRDGDFQVMRFGQTADYNHPETFLAPFLANSPLNQTGYHDEVFERTMREAAATADAKESIRLYREAERRALEAMSRIPLYFYTRSTLVKPWVRGFRGNVLNPHAIQFLRIDPEWQRGGPDTPVCLPPELGPPGILAP
jgi:oligopeptide transport system substrate-binding protein